MQGCGFSGVFVGVGFLFEGRVLWGLGVVLIDSFLRENFFTGPTELAGEGKESFGIKFGIVLINIDT